MLCCIMYMYYAVYVPTFMVNEVNHVGPVSLYSRTGGRKKFTYLAESCLGHEVKIEVTKPQAQNEVECKKNARSTFIASNIKLLRR